jgi:alpha-D-xyloside xylohydrolase
MPVFARAGSVLVRQPYRRNESGAAPKRLLLDVHTGADDSFRLYEDAGDGRAYRRGEHSFTRIVHDDRGGAGATVTIGRARGSFPGRRTSRSWELRLVGAERPRAVRIDGRAAKWSYDAAARTLTIRTPSLSTARAARIAVLAQR